VVPVAANLRIIHKGATVAESTGTEISFTPTEAGAYRMEAWLTVDGELRPWIYSNPIYMEPTAGRGYTLPPPTISESVEVRKNLVYVEGREEDANKHKLDLYLPKGKSNFPVLIFLHGGSWRSGDRADYPALGNRFAGEGFGVVVPSYRLLPGSPHPAQVEDAAAAVEWTLQNIASHGGDMKRVYLSGHSAGGHLAAWVGVDARFRERLKGVIAMSGIYDLSSLGLFISGSVNPSPIQLIAPGTPPFLITYCQNDYPTLPKQARDFHAALRQKGNRAELVFVPGKNHISEMVDIHQPTDPTARAILEFIASLP
jgi:acetyl esterase/lipase